MPKVHRVVCAKDFWELFYSFRVEDNHHIPLNKILFSLERKNLLSVIIEEVINSAQHEAERKFLNVPSSAIRRLHFLANDPDKAEVGEYGGYCDLRHDGTVLEAFITIKTVRQTITHL